MAFTREKRVALIRGFTAFLLWALIAGCFFTSVRTLSLVSQAVSYVRGKAVTPQAAEEQRLAAETARGFAVEWATFDGSDAKDYSERLVAYTDGGYSIEPPLGVQRCVSASVLSVNKVGDDGLYRVKVALHVSRVVNLSVSDSMSVSPVRGVVTRQDVLSGGKVASSTPPAAGVGSDEASYLFWKEFVNCVEVSVQVVDGRAVVVGLPVLTPFPEVKGEDPGSMMGKEEVPQDFSVFVSQALDLYYNGKDMANFVAPGADVKPLGGFKLLNASVVSYERRRGGARALVSAEITTDGVSKMTQLVVLEAVKKDRWLLKRLGSW